jgi:hypothetical protein
LKKKIIADHMTGELTKALNGVGNSRLPGAVAEIVAENWCDKLPFGDPTDWISRLNAAAGNPDYKPPEPKPEREARSNSWWGILLVGLVALSVGYLLLFGR